jgi:hypothetical protein
MTREKRVDMKKLIPIFLISMLLANCKLFTDSDGENENTGPRNGKLANTRWQGDRVHSLTDGPLGPFSSDNKIIINNDTTTVEGSFFGSYVGTFPSYYSTITPGLTIPTAPHVYVSIDANHSIDIRDNWNELYIKTNNDTIFWYFREY